MQFKKTLEIKANHKQVVIDVADILYIKASVNVLLYKIKLLWNWTYGYRLYDI